MSTKPIKWATLAMDKGPAASIHGQTKWGKVAQGNPPSAFRTFEKNQALAKPE